MNTSDYRYLYDRVRHTWLRRRYRERIESIYHQLIAHVDQAAFIDRLRAFWDPFAGVRAAKYLTLEIWLREAIFRYLLCTARMKAGGRIVDLGSGTGYFLWVCREFGYDILAVDVPDEPLYDACLSQFNIPRIVHRIEPMVRLCEFGSDVTMVTAFMTRFDQYDDSRRWDVAAWSFFLTDVRERLKVDGRLAIKFNADARTGELYARDVQRAFCTRSDFHARQFLDYVFFRAR